MAINNKELQMGTKPQDINSEEFDPEEDDTLESGEGDDELEEDDEQPSKKSGDEDEEGDDEEGDGADSEEDDSGDGADQTNESESEADFPETLESDIEEAITKQASKSKIDRAKLRSINDDLRAREYAITRNLKQYKFGDKTIYQLTPEEMVEAVQAIYTNDLIKPEDKDEWARDAISERKKYFKKLEEEGLIADNQKAMALDAKIWEDDWRTVQEQILKANPKLEAHLKEVNEHILKERQRKPYLDARLKQSPQEKFLYLLEVMDELGIDLRERANMKDSKPTPTKSASVGKGKKIDAKASRKPIYTTSQIRAMSMEEFDKHEDAISLAQREGRVKRK